jgi:hypothetical protein
MWDMEMQPSLSSAAADLPEVLWLLIPVCVGIVGLAAALVLLEAVRYCQMRRVRAVLERTLKSQALTTVFMRFF